jgi:glycine hydroxymethyltransferase
MSNLQNNDPEVYQILTKERTRQSYELEMIASENFVSPAVLEAVGSEFMNKYAEGYPGNRYYSGCENVDKLELLCQERALSLFGLSPDEWGVNVQALSGSVANFCAYNAVLNVGDKISGLHLPDGGHLTHGFETPKKKISATSVYFDSHPYHLDDQGYINYNELETIAKQTKLDMVICGYSAYPRDLNYKKFREIANINNSFLLCDMAHFSGLVSSGVLSSPFEYCDIITTTTHKTLRGCRGALIFYRKRYEQQINFSVFPRHQGGPFMHSIAGIAVALKEAQSEEYKDYTKQIVKNTKVFIDEMKQNGYTFITDGSDNHIALLNVKCLGLSGKKVEYILQQIGITVNKNTIPGDTSALNPGGIRIGSPALTTRGLTEEDFIQIAKWYHQVISLALECNSKKYSEFVSWTETLEIKTKLIEMKNQTTLYMSRFISE